MGFFDESSYPSAFLLGCIIQVMLAAIYRKQLAGLFDLFFLNLVYISFGCAGLAFVYFSTDNERILNEIGLMFLWLIAFGAALASRIKGRHDSSNAVARYRLPLDKLSFGIVVVIYALYVFQILSSGLLSLGAALIDSRFAVQQENKFQAYLFSAVGFMPAIFIFRIWPNLSAKKFLLFITPFWLVQAGTLSKTGLLFPVFMCALYFSLRIKSKIAARPSIAKQTGALFILSAAIFAIIYAISEFLLETTKSPLVVLMDRLFISFDGLVYFAQMNFKLEGQLSLVQWYLSPFLKVLGIYSQPYNAFNFVVADHYFGYGSDYSGNLPNNNHIGEIIATFPEYGRGLAAIFTAALYAACYKFAIRQVINGGRFIMPAAFVAATPFGFLIDGQGWMTAFLCSCGLMIATNLALFGAACSMRILKLASQQPSV